MRMLPRAIYPAAIALLALLAGPASAQVGGEDRPLCTEDVMIVFDASGSMAGNNVEGLLSTVTRIDEVRKALGQVLPTAAKFRKVGLITYGPGPYKQCNVRLNFEPMWQATKPIMSTVNRLNPAGKTPLVQAVKTGAAALGYPDKPGVIVLVTDGEETCGGTPCELGKAIKTKGRLTVHVIGYQLGNFRWTGAQSYLDVKCLAEETGGHYISAKTREDLVKAFEKTLGCPMMTSVGDALRKTETLGVMR